MTTPQPLNGSLHNFTYEDLVKDKTLPWRLRARLINKIVKGPKKNPSQVNVKYKPKGKAEPRYTAKPYAGPGSKRTKNVARYPVQTYVCVLSSSGKGRPSRRIKWRKKITFKTQRIGAVL